MASCENGIMIARTHERALCTFIKPYVHKLCCILVFEEIFVMIRTLAVREIIVVE